MRLVFAVSSDANAVALLESTRPPNLLLSFAYASSYAPISYQPDLLLLDSGAFSAWNASKTTDLHGYGQFAQQMAARRSAPTWAINLDVIPGSVGKSSTGHERELAMTDSLRNADVLRRKYQLPIAEVFHQDEPLEYLDCLVSRMPSNGLLCLSPRNDVSVAKRARWCWSVTDYWRRKFNGDLSRFPRCHGLAVTARECLEAFPFWSVDSTTWAVAFRYGRKIRPDGAQIDMTQVTDFPSSRVLAAQKIVVCQSMANLQTLEQHATQLWATRGVRWA